MEEDEPGKGEDADGAQGQPWPRGGEDVGDGEGEGRGEAAGCVR